MTGDILDKERERITTLLRWNGYYGFNRDYLGYIADSSFNQNVVDLDMSIETLSEGVAQWVGRGSAASSVLY